MGMGMGIMLERQSSFRGRLDRIAPNLLRKIDPWFNKRSILTQVSHGNKLVDIGAPPGMPPSEFYDMDMNLRMRRLPPRLPIGKLYEIEIPAGGGIRRIVTRSPLSVLDSRLGTGDAWSLIVAANREWDGKQGGWVSLLPPR